MRKLPSGSTAKPGLAWQALYEAALFETDRGKIPALIAQAEQAIFARIKELFAATGDHIEEEQVLDDALYALRALRNCSMTDANAA
jgi:hypothetical protein